MAYENPKTDWNETYTPSPQDFNRIEGNIEHLKDGDVDFNGLKTFADGIETDTIVDISGNGLTIEGVRMKDGVIYGLVWGN